MISIGNIIKKERKKQNISQEELCDGICTAGYLSKIESGTANPSGDVIEKLMQRLGKQMSRYVNYKTERDYDIDNLKYDIRRYYATGDYDLHLKALNDLKRVADGGDDSLQQFILLHTSFIQKRNGVSPSELLKVLEKALKLTKKEINLLDLSSEFLTQDETVIINNMAIHIKSNGQLNQGIDILLELKKYLDHPRIDQDEKRRAYPIVICNLTKWLCNSKRYYECIAISDDGIGYSIKNDSLAMLADVTFNKGYALNMIGNTKEALDYITQSYFINKACGNEKSVQLIKEYVLETFNLEL